MVKLWEFNDYQNKSENIYFVLPFHFMKKKKILELYLFFSLYYVLRVFRNSIANSLSNTNGTDVLKYYYKARLCISFFSFRNQQLTLSCDEIIWLKTGTKLRYNSYSSVLCSVTRIFKLLGNRMFEIPCANSNLAPKD